MDDKARAYWIWDGRTEPFMYLTTLGEFRHCDFVAVYGGPNKKLVCTLYRRETADALRYYRRTGWTIERTTYRVRSWK
jgi:hypothetical protein